MGNNYETLRMPELKALARERKLRGYSRLRKAELIDILQDEDRRQEELPTREPELEVPQPLTKRQLKCRRNKNSKLTLSGLGGAQRPGWPNSQLPLRNLLSYDAQTW